METEEGREKSSASKPAGKPARDALGRLLPGNTANPYGKPPGTLSLVSLLKKHLEEVPDGEKRSRAQAFIEKTLNQAMKGDPANAKLVWQYIEGLPQQKVDVTTGGKPISILSHVHGDDGDKEDTETP